MRLGESSSSKTMWYCSSAYSVITFVALLHMGALPGSVKAISVHIQHDDHFVAVSGKNFVINGAPFFVNGWNSYWMMTQAVEEGTRHRVVSILQRGAALGMTVCRTWAFNDATYNALQMSPGMYSEQTFQVIDIVPQFIHLPRAATLHSARINMCMFYNAILHRCASLLQCRSR